MSDLGLFILDGKRNPIPAKDTIEWAEWFRSNDKRVAFTEIKNVRVSTIFLGIDHGWTADDPIVFETMIFGGEHDGDQWRFATWNGALGGHKVAVELVRASRWWWRYVQMYRNLKKFFALLWWRLRR